MLDISPPEWPLDSVPPESGTVGPSLFAVFGMALAKLKAYCARRSTRLVVAKIEVETARSLNGLS